MKRKATPSRTRRSGSRKAGPSTGLRTGPSTRHPSATLRAETEMPLDAEDVALASLDARVRAAEARSGGGPAEPLIGLTMRLPRAVVLRLRARAAEQGITPSQLVEIALATFLPPGNAGRRRR